MKTFKDYKKFVESIKIKFDDGYLGIDLDNTAKYPGEFQVEYKYNVFKELDNGNRINYFVLPPIKVKDYKKG